MKSLILVLASMMISNIAFGKQICQKDDNGKETCYRDSDVDLNGKYQERYDSDMKSAGKWDFISDSLLLMTLVSLGGTYYSLDKYQKLDDLSKQRPLTADEEKQRKKWDNYTQTGAGAVGGCLILGVVGWGVQLHYENRAHMFALEVGTSW